jgi:hypothetical protein
LLIYCSLFISMASIPKLSAIRIVKCCQIIVCDSRILGPFVFGVEAYMHCLLKIPLNVTLTLARCSPWKMCCRDRIYLSWDEYNTHSVEPCCSTDNHIKYLNHGRIQSSRPTLLRGGYATDW